MSLHQEEFVEKDVAVAHHDEVSNELKQIVALNSIEETPTSRVVWAIAVCVSVGGFLFGESRLRFTSPYLTTSRL